jgi:ferredoxin-NADP reductase
MTAQPVTLQLRIAEVRELNPLIRMLRLRAEDGRALPGFAAGAHIRVKVSLPGGETGWRHYSLINFATERNATNAPAEYVIAVRKEAEGRGGSRFMHEQLKEGDTLTIESPKNDFPLHTGPGGTVLVAGGIGITPLATMAARRRAEGAPVRMHYAGRSRELMAFLPELQALLGDDLRVHADAETGAPLDIDALLDGVPAGDRLYVCGPKVMLDAVLARTQARGWEHDLVHFELFTEPVVEEGDQPFEVELAQSGQRFTVPADQSILDCLIENGCDPMFDCKRGECGVCATPVLEGEIDHRDYVLTAREKAEGTVMQICISRAKGARLVLDI